MSHISTAELARLTGYTKRQIQRMASKLPGAVRTDGGHWAIPDSPEVRKWCQSQASGRERERSRRERKKSSDYWRDVVLVADARAVDLHQAERIVVEQRMLRHMANLEKAIWMDGAEWTDTVNKKLPLEMARLATWMLKFSERWQSSNSAV